jgi:pimeloyl-ACP methyl ester carboxylesterase
MAEPTNLALLHGGGQGAWVWDETRAALEQQAGGRLHVVAFDLPGCGTKRAQHTADLTVRDVAGAFIADLRTSGMTDITLAGHSNAGTILPIVAAMAPHLIRRYVYVSCIAPPPGMTVIEVMTEGRTKAPVHDTLSGGRRREMFCTDMPADHADAFMARLGRDSWPTLRALEETEWAYDHLIDKPSTYVICLRDQALRPEWQEAFATRVHARHRVRIDTGHQVMNTRPQALAEILRLEASCV